MMKIPKYKKYREFMEDLIKRCDTNNLIREMITEPCSNGITLKKDSNIYAMLESLSEDDAMLKAILTDYLKYFLYSLYIGLPCRSSTLTSDIGRIEQFTVNAHSVWSALKSASALTW